MTTERQSRAAKVIAAAFGADVGEDDRGGNKYGPSDDHNFRGSESLQDLPFNLGYEKIT